MEIFYVFLLCLIFCLLGYLLGSIILGAIITRIMDIDIRNSGSGNIGSTNILRTMGKKFALLTFLWDSFKGWLSVFISLIIYINYKSIIPNYFSGCGFIIYIGGLFAIIGHCWPITYLIALIKNKFNFSVCKKFSGGKGAATTAGVLISLSPWIFIISFILFFVIFFITRYVSLSSITSIFIGSILTLVPNLDYFYMFSMFHYNEFINISSIQNEFINPTINFDENWGYLFAVFTIFFLISIIVVYKHKSNIYRLLTGTENKISKKNKYLYI